MRFGFSVAARDPGSRARRGVLSTAHGIVDTPAFMPVGTKGSVTGLDPDELARVGASMVLANTYHLMLRPGPELFRRVGGLHPFMRWSGPVLTDSGGYQVFSLAGDRTVTEEGARFTSYVDGQPRLLSPEGAIELQEALRSDVMMVLDECIEATSDDVVARAAMERTHRWALRGLAARRDPAQGLFAIVQGSVVPALRHQSAAFLTSHPFDGFAIGGLAVGETRPEREDITAFTAEQLPDAKPRYLMGVGTPPDILFAIGCGVDLFDCVLPTRLAWQGIAFTSTGRVRLTRGAHRDTDDALDAACPCSTCRQFSRAYLHHLVKSSEPLGPRLLSLHNLHHYLHLMRAAREAISTGSYAAFSRQRLLALDRREHDEEGAETLGQRQSRRARLTAASARGPRHELVSTKTGAIAVRSLADGEVMHPGIGPRLEADRLYVGQSRLVDRLRVADQPDLVVYDVGLGAGSNALAAWSASEVAPPSAARLVLVSFERDLGALELALAHADDFGWSGAAAIAARAVLAAGRYETARTSWRLERGDALEALNALDQRALGPSLGGSPDRSDLRADIIYWDPFSPRANPSLWTVAAFAAARRRARPGCTFFTYSASTAVRVALLLGGWAVGVGDATGDKTATTAAAISTRDLMRPLDREWLARVARPDAPLPADAPADAVARVAALPQFALARAV